ncbi:hypothetical protein KAR52_01050 [Candidatus Pacearchaeota archaeon]|nr:hypothetical protein [Candidatus Pacearchaeota archaeon]
MVKEWRKEEAKSTSGNILEAGIGGMLESPGGEGYPDELTFGEMKNQPASKYVTTKQRWCKDRFVAESYGKNKKIEEGANKMPFKIIQKAIEEHNPKSFSVNDIIKWTDATNKTDKGLQHKVLSLMICLGLIKNKHIKFKDKKGKEKFRKIFIVVKEQIKCPNLINGKCSFDWKTGAVTDYFPEEYKETTDLI